MPGEPGRDHLDAISENGVSSAVGQPSWLVTTLAGIHVVLGAIGCDPKLTTHRDHPVGGSSVHRTRGSSRFSHALDSLILLASWIEVSRWHGGDSDGSLSHGRFGATRYQGG